MPAASPVGALSRAQRPSVVVGQAYGHDFTTHSLEQLIVSTLAPLCAEALGGPFRHRSYVPVSLPRARAGPEAAASTTRGLASSSGMAPASPAVPKSEPNANTWNTFRCGPCPGMGPGPRYPRPTNE